MRTLTTKKSFWQTCAITNTIGLIILLLMLPVQISAFGMWFYEWQFAVNDTYAVVNMQPGHLHEVARHIIHYMQTNLDRNYGLQIETVVGGEIRYFFSPIEIRHMVDVYDLFAIGFIVRNILVLLTTITSAAFVLWGKGWRPLLWKAWRIGTAGIFIILSILAAIISINWVRAWHIFHYIFFNNDYWLLDPRVDLLVNIVPYPFFLAMSTFIGVCFAAALIIMFVTSCLCLRKSTSIDNYFFR